MFKGKIIVLECFEFYMLRIRLFALRHSTASDWDASADWTATGKFFDEVFSIVSSVNKIGRPKIQTASLMYNKRKHRPLKYLNDAQIVKYLITYSKSQSPILKTWSKKCKAENRINNALLVKYYDRHNRVFDKPQKVAAIYILSTFKSV